MQIERIWTEINFYLEWKKKKNICDLRFDFHLFYQLALDLLKHLIRFLWKFVSMWTSSRIRVQKIDHKELTACQLSIQQDKNRSEYRHVDHSKSLYLVCVHSYIPAGM